MSKHFRAVRVSSEVLADGEHLCCRCGTVHDIGFRLDWLREEGHGPHFTKQVAVYDWPSEPCPSGVVTTFAGTPDGHQTEVRNLHTMREHDAR